MFTTQKMVLSRKLMVVINKKLYYLILTLVNKVILSLSKLARLISKLSERFGLKLKPILAYTLPIGYLNNLCTVLVLSTPCIKFKTALVRNSLITYRNKKTLLEAYELTLKQPIRVIHEKRSTLIKIMIIVKPFFGKIFFKDTQVTKMFIRNSSCFSKTRYSFIRQECKNITLITLLLNIISIVAVLSIYFKVSTMIILINSIQVIYILYNTAYLMGVLKNILIFVKLLEL